MNKKKDDIRLSAFILDELTPESQERLVKELENDPELFAEMDSLKKLSGELNQHFKNKPKQSLSELRLARIQKASAETASPFSIRKEYYAIAAIVLAAFATFITRQTMVSSQRENVAEVKKEERPRPIEKKMEKPKPTALASNEPVRESPYVMQNHTVATESHTHPNQASAASSQNMGKVISNKSPNKVLRTDFADAGVTTGLSGPGAGKVLGVSGAGGAVNNFGGLGGLGSGTGLGIGFGKRLGGGARFNPDPGVPAGNETYAMVKENGFITTKDDPRSTFSADVDTASYANVRRFIEQGQRPPVDAIRVEEMINYFRYDYPAPKEGQPFSTSMDVFSAPWNPEHRLVRIGIKGQDMKWGHRPALNLVFLVDVSGSMNSSEKMPLVKNSLKLVVDQMSAKDHIALVTYAGNSGVALPPTAGDKKAEIMKAIDLMEAGGGTNGSGGIQVAYNLVQKSFQSGAVNRVVLATDGDFNIGRVNEGDLTRLIQEKASKGIQLTVLGFGMGNTNDKIMELLADKGNGNYAYIDSILEAKKALVKEIGATMITIAQDVKLQVEFNPQKVDSYRLIGYENRVLAHQDFNDDKKDAGDIGAGHAVTAFYEIVPAGKGEKAKVDDLKYSKTQVNSDASDELLTLKLRYKQPGGKESKLLSSVLKDQGESFSEAGKDFKFASAVAMFGMTLRNSKDKGSSSFGEALKIARANAGDDDYRRDFLKLAEKASRGFPGGVSASEYAGIYGRQNGRPRQGANVEMGFVVVSGGFTEQEVRAVVRANLNQIRHCYETLLQSSPNANGRVKLTSTIDAHGLAKGTSIITDTVGDSTLTACVSSKMTRWKYPPPRGEEPVNFSVIYVFSP